MKRTQFVVVVLNMLAAGLLVAGCSKVGEPAQAPATNALPVKTAAEALIEDITGKTVVDQSLKTRDKIQKIGEEHNKDVEEVTQ